MDRTIERARTAAKRADAFRRAAQRKAGAGWNLLGEELQQALVAREVLYGLCAQDASVASTTTVDRWQTIAALALEPVNSLLGIKADDPERER